MNSKKPKEDEHYICADCVILFMFRLPKYTIPDKKIGICVSCDKRGILYKKKDLVPGWKDEG